MPKTLEGKPETYLNPVYPHSFPDPFVLKFRGEYFGYCTGDADDGNIFKILRSRDLVNWEFVGSGMEPLASRPPFYWAPEVVYDNGKFYLYYSAGNEILMEIRVAVSNRPDGGFVDAGVRLTKEEFAIDAHVFIDSDGTRYLFYATDFLEHSHIGTGTVVDRMVDWKTLEGKPRPVTRAKYDWQVYDPARKEKGGVRWHTVEGPTVLKRKGKYFEMFSGGNWQNKSYGVSFAIANSMHFTEEWEQFSDGERILPILRTIPEKVIGPGHNSVVRGPNNRELYCIYHRWTDQGRVLAIDRMDFSGDRLFVAGPTTDDQPAPFFAESVTNIPPGWSQNGTELVSSGERCELEISKQSAPVLIECTFRFSEFDRDSLFGIEGGDCRFSLTPAKRKATLELESGKTKLDLRRDFDPAAFHLLRVESGLGHLSITIDDISQTVEVAAGKSPSAFKLVSEAGRVCLSAIEVTTGFEERFENEASVSDLAFYGDRKWFPGYMTLSPSDSSKTASLNVELPFAEFQIAVNIAVNEETDAASYGVLLYEKVDSPAASLSIFPGEMSVRFESGGESVDINLPDAFTGNEYRQLRLIRSAGTLMAYLDGIRLSELPLKSKVSAGSVFGTVPISIEMLRVTAI